MVLSKNMFESLDQHTEQAVQLSPINLQVLQVYPAKNVTQVQSVSKTLRKKNIGKTVESHSSNVDFPDLSAKQILTKAQQKCIIKENNNQSKNAIRYDNFYMQTDAKDTAKKLTRTKPCKNVTDYGICTRQACTFAHSLEEWVPPPCGFGRKCYRQSGKKDFNTGLVLPNTRCQFKHPDETTEEYFKRTDTSLPNLPQTSENTRKEHVDNNPAIQYKTRAYEHLPPCFRPENVTTTNKGYNQMLASSFNAHSTYNKPTNLNISTPYGFSPKTNYHASTNHHQNTNHNYNPNTNQQNQIYRQNTNQQNTNQIYRQYINHQNYQQNRNQNYQQNRNQNYHQNTTQQNYQQNRNQNDMNNTTRKYHDSNNNSQQNYVDYKNKSHQNYLCYQKNKWDIYDNYQKELNELNDLKDPNFKSEQTYQNYRKKIDENYMNFEKKQTDNHYNFEKKQSVNYQRKSGPNKQNYQSQQNYQGQQNYQNYQSQQNQENQQTQNPIDLEVNVRQSPDSAPILDDDSDSDSISSETCSETSCSEDKPLQIITVPDDELAKIALQEAFDRGEYNVKIIVEK